MLLGEVDSIIKEINLIPDYMSVGEVVLVRGLLIEVKGLNKSVSIGSRCKITARDGRLILAEVVGIDEDRALLMSFHDTVGIGVGCDCVVVCSEQVIYPSIAWLGRVINAFGEPIDNASPLTKGSRACHLRASPPPAYVRKRVMGKLDMGIRSLNSFVTCCKGQRMGIFAGSGVGKSMMLAMITRFAAADIKIIGLIGERGREVQEFLDDYLGKEGLAKAIVIVATSDESALARKQAAYLTMTLAEYFRDEEMEVLCMMDNITRFAMAQREIGLTAGEPPTNKGYTPSVFSELPKLLERAGPGTQEQGSITGLFSVLVEGDDHNEPIADAVRGTIDGHITLSRDIAMRAIYPAVDVLKSVSRLMPGCNSDMENKLINKARSMIAIYNDMADMIRIGAYKKGSDPEVEEAIKYNDAINAFIAQKPGEYDTIESSYKKLALAINFNLDASSVK